MSDPRVQGLFAAIYEEDAERVASLLAAGVSAGARNEYGTTPLYWAAIEGGSWMIGLLLTAGADPKEASGGEGEGTPLCGAACFGLRSGADAGQGRGGSESAGAVRYDAAHLGRLGRVV